MFFEEGLTDLMIREAIQDAVRCLHAAGVDDARQDAWILLAHVCRQNRATLLAKAHDHLDADGLCSFQQMITRRAAREPIALIVGQKEFWSLEFQITSDVLCPRADSETLIQAALEQVEERGRQDRWPGQILDLGTGSGCLLLALLSEFTSAHGVGVDGSRRALLLAQSNGCLLYTSPSPRDQRGSRMPSSA